MPAGWAKAQSAAPIACFTETASAWASLRSAPRYEAQGRKGGGTPTDVGAILRVPVRGRGARPAGRARLSAFHRGSHRRGFRPSGATSGQASWDVAGALDPVRPSNRGRRSRTAHAGVTRARLSQSRECTSRTGRNAGQHDARSRPGAECIAPRAGTALAPLPGVPSAEGVLYRAGVCCITEPVTFVNEMVTHSVTVHYRLPISSLPDLIRQSMTPRRPMDHRVKPGGDDQEARSVTSSRSGVLHLRVLDFLYALVADFGEQRLNGSARGDGTIKAEPFSARRPAVYLSDGVAHCEADAVLGTRRYSGSAPFATVSRPGASIARAVSITFVAFVAVRAWASETSEGLAAYSVLPRLTAWAFCQLNGRAMRPISATGFGER